MGSTWWGTGGNLMKYGKCVNRQHRVTICTRRPISLRRYMNCLHMPMLPPSTERCAKGLHRFNVYTFLLLWVCQKMYFTFPY